MHLSLPLLRELLPSSSFFYSSLPLSVSSSPSHMREPGNEALFLPERKKVSMKVNSKDEGAEGRRRLSGGGYGGSYGGGKAAVANNHISSMAVTGVRLKGGSTLPSRHHSHNLLSEKEVVAGEGESLNRKRTAEDESVLPQWGHGKRSRCSRFEPSKHAAPVTDLVSKSAPRSEKNTQPPAPKLRASPKLTSNKTISNGFLPRNNPIHRTSNGFTSNSMPPLTVRQNAGEAKERVAQKERAPGQQKNVSASYRQLQGSDGSELATTTQGHVHCNGNMTKGMNNTTNISSGPCNGHINKIDGNNNNNNNATCVSASEPIAPAKPRVDLQTLEWPRIVIALTRKEKEDDFLVLKGTKLPQRPKKRPKVVEKALHYCTPGNWLIDLSRGRYDVREKKSCKKKPRGLKAMESLESDSE